MTIEELKKLVKDYEALEEECYKTAKLLNKLNPDKYEFGRRRHEVDFDEETVTVTTVHYGNYNFASFPIEWIGKTEEELKECIKSI